MTRQKIVDISIDCDRCIAAIVRFISRYFSCTRAKTAVLGLSGGVDSSTVAYLAERALGKDRVIGLIMPYRTSSNQSIKDASMVVSKLGIRAEKVDISALVDGYFKRDTGASHLRRGNKMARERMSILYDYACKFGGIVLGTGNKSETMVGYFTKHGDGGCDLLPLGGLYKTQVWEVARCLGVPECIITKTPSADLWMDQFDEDEIGVSYCILDQVLYLLVDKKMSVGAIVKKGFGLQTVRRIAMMIESSRHKRSTPPFPKCNRFLK